MKPPYLVCSRHCRWYLHCRPTFTVWSLYRRLTGRSCPLEKALADASCPFFMPGKREPRLPELEVVR